MQTTDRKVGKAEVKDGDTVIIHNVPGVEFEVVAVHGKRLAVFAKDDRHQIIQWINAADCQKEPRW